MSSTPPQRIEELMTYVDTPISRAREVLPSEIEYAEGIIPRRSQEIAEEISWNDNLTGYIADFFNPELERSTIANKIQTLESIAPLTYPVEHAHVYERARRFRMGQPLGIPNSLFIKDLDTEIAYVKDQKHLAKIKAQQRRFMEAMGIEDSKLNQSGLTEEQKRRKEAFKKSMKRL